MMVVFNKSISDNDTEYQNINNSC